MAIQAGSTAVKSLQAHVDHQFQMGVVLRAARQLLHCHTYDDVVTLMVSVVEELGVSGLIQVTGFEFRGIQKCGAGLSRHSTGELRKLMLNDAKIPVQGTLMLFKWPSALLALDVGDIAPLKADQLRDDMALLLDSVQQWLDKQRQKCELENVICERLRAFQYNLQTGVESMHQDRDALADQILAEFAAMLPLLSMDEDQENAILDALQQVIRSIGRSLNQHSQMNEEIIQVVHELLDFVRSSGQAASVDPVLAVELF